LNFASILPSSFLDLLPINLQGTNVPVGVNCDPINVIGAGGNSCSQQTVCCENNNFVRLLLVPLPLPLLTAYNQSGLIAIGCTPINIGL
jgi:hypothetical protein